MKVSNSDSKSIAVVVADLTFVPTMAQMKTKASFQTNWAGLTTPTEGDVAQITGSTSIQKWWAQPGFKDWFTGADQTSAQLALKTAEEILTDPDAAAAARVNMVKLVLQYEGALEEKKMASSVQTVKKVSTQELIKRLESVKGTIDVESETNT